MTQPRPARDDRDHWAMLGRIRASGDDEYGRADPDAELGWAMIGAMVRERRRVVGWTQRQLEAACGVTQPAISRLENGRLRGLRWARCGRVVAVLGGLDPAQPRPTFRRRHW